MLHKSIQAQEISNLYLALNYSGFE
jgi:hypothetical protein